MKSILARILEPEIMDSPQDALEYDRMDFREVNKDFALAALNLGAKGNILDIGTGTARIPITLCRLATTTIHITAIDLAQSMLDLARDNVAEAKLNEQITLELVDAKKLPYPDRFFDMVISNSIVHHLPDPRPCLSEAMRVLKLGGGLLIRDLMRPNTIGELEEKVTEIGEDYSKYQKDLFYNSLRAAFTLEEMEEILRECDYQGVKIYQSSDRHWTVTRSMQR